MNRLTAIIQSRIARDERGVTAIEYGLLAVLIAVVIIVAVTLLGTSLRDLYDSVNDTMP